MKIKSIGLYSTILILLLFLPVSGIGTEKYAFLKVPQGVKAAGLGGSFVAIADDPSTIYWNPAGLTTIPSKEIYSSYSSWLQGTNITNFIFTSNLAPHAFGISLYNLSYGIINETSSTEPQGTGKSYSPFDAALTLSYAYDFKNNISIGTNLNIISENLGEASSAHNCFDLGMLFRGIYSPDTTLGITYKNILQSKIMQESIKTGISYKRIIPEENKPNSLSTVSMDIDMNSVSKPLFSYGIEYLYYSLIALRFGYMDRNQTGAGGNVSLGLGLIFKRFQFDLAFVPYDNLGDTYRVAIQYGL